MKILYLFTQLTKILYKTQATRQRPLRSGRESRYTRRCFYDSLPWAALFLFIQFFKLEYNALLCCVEHHSSSHLFIIKESHNSVVNKAVIAGMLLLLFSSISHLWLFCGPMDYNPPDSCVHGISKARIWNGLPFPSPGVFLTQGSNLHLLHWQADFLPLSHQGGVLKSPASPSMILNGLNLNLLTTSFLGYF